MHLYYCNNSNIVAFYLSSDEILRGRGNQKLMGVAVCLMKKSYYKLIANRQMYIKIDTMSLRDTQKNSRQPDDPISDCLSINLKPMALASSFGRM